jgi:hypothetical protein
MKALNVFVGCVILSVAITASAQNVNSLLFTLDTTPVHEQLWGSYKLDSVLGYIQNLTADSVYFNFEYPFVSQWLILPEIPGNPVGIGPHETLPVLIQLYPYPERPDTENACFIVTPLHGSAAVQEHCISLYLLASSGVPLGEPSSNSSAFYPNPLTSSSIIVLTPEQAARKFKVNIFDESGRDVSKNFAIRVLGDSITIERRNAPSGSYYYRLIDEASSQPFSIIETGKFVVQ